MKHIIGMIHLAGGVARAIDEIALYEANGVEGALVENYHGGVQDVERTLDRASEKGFSLELGVNILPNEFEMSFALADRYGASFIQLDYVAGRYDCGVMLDAERYAQERVRHPHIRVLGGVWPKYYTPIRGSSLDVDIIDGCDRADVIVVTGASTGCLTPIDKIRRFRVRSTRPLYIGAGITAKSAAEQLAHADGAIVGSYFKDGETSSHVRETRVRELMRVVRNIG